MKDCSKKFNLRYGLIQASYWALSGIIFGFTAVYLQGKQYTNYDIGIIFALGNIVGFIAQPLVAGHIDKTRQRTLLRCILIAAALSLALMISVLFMPTACLPLSAAFVLLIGGNILFQPLCISLYFYLESIGSKINFSAARAVGSFFYALANVALGILVERVSAQSVPVSYIIFTAALGALTLSLALGAKPKQEISELQAGQIEKPRGIIEFLRETTRSAL